MLRRQKIPTAAELTEQLLSEADEKNRPHRPSGVKKLVDFLFEYPVTEARKWADLTLRVE